MKRWLVMIVGLVLVLLSVGKTVAQEDGEEVEPAPEITEEEINQNIKDRLKKVAEEQDSLVVVNRKQALVGELQSLANGTLTIKTKNEIKLASVSASTDFVRNPGSKAVEEDDVAIGDFVVAMGHVNGTEVLEAKRVLLYASAPKPIAKKSVFGTISELDEEELTFTIITPFGDETMLEVDEDSTLLITGDDEEIDFENLIEDQMALVVYSPAEDEEETNLILSLLVLPAQETENEEIEEEEVEEETIPPELGL